MADKGISKEVLQFLERLKKNNNREWFAGHKNEFDVLKTEVRGFYQALLECMKSHDTIGKLKMFRIYRDVRFSKDKTPYQPHFAGSFSRAGARLRGGYYLRIKPGETFIATGFWGPEKDDLWRIRKEFEQDASKFRKTISTPSLKKIWGTVQGEEVKTAPKGFNKGHPDIDLIRKKQFIFVKTFSDKEVLYSDFISEVNNAFKAIRPYFDLMSEILTTNINGEPLLD
jgi:uncharacterized protein (TIGR02453 family)